MTTIMERAGIEVFGLGVRHRLTGFGNVCYYGRASARPSGLTGERQLGECGSVSLPCPLCHVNPDVQQRQIGEGMVGTMVVCSLCTAQLVGLAFGMKPTGVGLEKSFVGAESLLR